MTVRVEIWKTMHDVALNINKTKVRINLLFKFEVQKSNLKNVC